MFFCVWIFLLNVLSLLLLAEKWWLWLFYCFNGTWGGKVIQILAKGSFLTQLESGKVGANDAPLEYSEEMRCPPFDDQLLCSVWGFSLESSNAVAENTILIEDSSSPWLALLTSVHHSPLGHWFMRLYQVTHLRLPVTPSQEGNPLCLTLLLPKGIYPNPHQES